VGKWGETEAGGFRVGGRVFGAAWLREKGRWCLTADGGEAGRCRSNDAVPKLPLPVPYICMSFAELVIDKEGGARPNIGLVMLINSPKFGSRPKFGTAKANLSAHIKSASNLGQNICCACTQSLYSAHLFFRRFVLISVYSSS